jgi:transcriptional regulator with XRE-family HTH domain
MQPLSTSSIQSVFLEQIRQILPKNLSFPDELAEVLNVSRDSVYRRIRGETILSLEEVKKLCTHYKISLDGLLAPSSEIISFRKRRIDPENFTLEKWLNSILADLERIEPFEDKEVIYSAKDIPPPYYFKFPGLTQFKLFFWLKSYQRHPKFDVMRYDPGMVSQQLIEISKKIWNKYSVIPTSEIWSDETFNVTVRQVQFYYENGFISLAEARSLIDEYLAMVQEIRNYAAQGAKSDRGVFKLYYNEFLLTDTTYLFKIGDQRIASITYNTLNLLTTTQESFCRETEDFLNNVINKSTLISTVGERERNKFFNQMEKRIVERRDYLKH